VTVSYYEGLNTRLAELVPTRARSVLEVGCGAGLLGGYLRDTSPGRTVWGVEIMEDVARQAEARLDGVVVGDLQVMEELPFADGTFDCVTFGDVLEHLVNPETVLRRLARYLSPEGEVVCCVPCVSHWSVVVELLRGDFPYADNGLLDRTHLRFFTVASFRRLLESAGYDVVEEEVIRVPNDGVTSVLSEAARAMGLDAATAADAATAYQMLFRARPRAAVRAAAMQETASVVIVTYNSMETIEQCLDSVLAADDCEVVVVDNASQDGTGTWLQRYAEQHPSVKVLQSAENLGFSAASNAGAAQGSGDYVVLLNPDTVVTPGWLSRMRHHFEGPGQIGAVGPTSDYVAGLQKVELYLPPASPRSTPAEVAETLARTHAGRSVPTQLLIGFCLMIPRPLFDKLGGLDPELFLGNDDLDLSWRLREAGYDLRVAVDAFVHHRGQVSFSTVPSATTARLVQESTDVLARKLRAHYGTGNVPTADEMWGISWFRPSFDLWAPPAQLVAVPDWSRTEEIEHLLAAWAGAFAADEPVSLVLGLPEESGLSAEEALEVLVQAVSDAGYDPDALADVALTPFGDDPAGLAGTPVGWIETGGVSTPTRRPPSGARVLTGQLNRTTLRTAVGLPLSAS
jgi:GT2 family glycosyltransferase/ubiquinone/menaquinone biosynthesis C-methylase UbiE